MDKKFLLLFSKRSAFFFEKKKQKTFIRWSLLQTIVPDWNRTR